MAKALLIKSVRVLVPTVLGAAGAWLLAAYPAFHAAFCSAR